MKLYGSEFLPFVRHCRIALAECRIPYEFIVTDYAQSAQQSPTARVPFVEDGALKLSDSASILRHIRSRAGQAFMPDIQDYELFLLANTGLDTSINLFLLEKDGLRPEQAPYLARQAARVGSVLQALNKHIAEQPLPDRAPFTDGQIRVGCYLSWALFRQRFDIDAHDALLNLLRVLDRWPKFSETDPRRTV